MLLDIIAAILLFAACIKGMREGLIGSVFSLLAWLIGLVAALKLSAVVALRLSENVTTSTKWLPFLSFIIVFVIVAFLVNMGGKFIQSTLETVMLGWINRMAGIVLYIVIYASIYSILLFYAVQLRMLSDETTKASIAYSYLSPIAPAITESVGSVIPMFKNIFTQLEGFFNDVSNKLQH